MLAYLFYVGDRQQTALAYTAPERQADGWYSLRHEAAMPPEALVLLAQAAVERYGFSDFQLQGGVMRGEEEMLAVTAIKHQFPRSRVTLDPNGAWSLQEASSLCKG